MKTEMEKNNHQSNNLMNGVRPAAYNEDEHSPSSSSSSSFFSSHSPLTYTQDPMPQVSGHSIHLDSNINQRPRTSEDFYLFCQLILEHEKYDEKNNEDEELSQPISDSPIDSGRGSEISESISSSVVPEEKNLITDQKIQLHATPVTEETHNNSSTISIPTIDEDSETDVELESYNLVTCYCGKPYAARPMIECSNCLTWLHFSCAKIKRKYIPEIFFCVKCRESDTEDSNVKSTKRRKVIRSINGRTTFSAAIDVKPSIRNGDQIKNHRMTHQTLLNNTV